MIFEMLQQLIELLFAAAAVGVDLYVIKNTLGHPRLDVVQVDSTLLIERRGNARKKNRKKEKKANSTEVDEGQKQITGKSKYQITE